MPRTIEPGEEEAEGEDDELARALFHRFDDPRISHESKGILMNLLKTLVQRERLVFVWYETEFLKQQVKVQMSEMVLPKDYHPFSVFRPLPLSHTTENVEALKVSHAFCCMRFN